MFDILIKHNSLWAGGVKKTGVRRDILDSLVSALEVRHIITIAGSRRSGKSYLFRQLQMHLFSKGVKNENILEINFEDPYFIHRKEDETLLPELYSQYLILKNPKGQKYIFLDEIQNIKNWQYWIRDIYDREEEVKFFITGSNAELLSVELNTHLTGRTVTFENFPFSFSELLNSYGVDFHQSKSLSELYEKNYFNKEMLLHHLENSFIAGFYPEICQISNTELLQNILKEYFTNVIFKDIVPRFSIRNANVIEELSYYLSTNFTSECSLSIMAEFLKSNVNTIKEYISYLEKAFLFYTVPFFDYSVKTQLRRNRKIYINDVGLRSATAFQFSKDHGRYLENIIFNHLRRKNTDIYYWKSSTQKEIDFIVKNKGQLIGVNVCYSDDLPEREFVAFYEAKKENIPLDKIIIVTKNRFEIVKDKGCEIQMIPAWVYLLH